MTKEYLDFIDKHKGKIKPLTKMESELMEFLIVNKDGNYEDVITAYRKFTRTEIEMFLFFEKHKLGGFEEIIKLYRTLSK